MRELYELVVLYQKLGIDAGEYRETLEKMYVVTMHLLAPDGQLVKFGDTDVQVVSELRGVMSLGAYLYQRGTSRHWAMSGCRSPCCGEWGRRLRRSMIS